MSYNKFRLENNVYFDLNEITSYYFVELDRMEWHVLKAISLFLSL